MELCDFTLNNYIQRSFKPRMVVKVPRLTDPELTSRARISHVWEIMEDVTKGVAFVHQNGYTHRDLKPRNSALFHLRSNEQYFFPLETMSGRSQTLASL
jgi:serine/threonine protein kinase